MWLITDFLPKAQVQPSQFQVHISYFLQNCKKGKSPKKDLPLLKNDITGSEPTVNFLDILQKHAKVNAPYVHPIFCILYGIFFFLTYHI